MTDPEKGIEPCPAYGFNKMVAIAHECCYVVCECDKVYCGNTNWLREVGPVCHQCGSTKWKVREQ